MNEYDETNNAINNEMNIYGKKTDPTPKPQPEFGIDNNQSIYDNIISSQGKNGGIDINALQGFTSTAQSRDEVYTLIDSMCKDSVVASVLETYAEDATETNDLGQVVWVEAEDPTIAAYVEYLLDTMGVDKHVYEWTYNLIKYGDTYLRLYRESDYDSDVLQKDLVNKYDKNIRSPLKEDVNIYAYKKNDNYSHYVEMVDNPAEVFELIKYGKTYAYVRADVTSQGTYVNDMRNTHYMQYKFSRNDVDLHGPMDYVHACLQDSSGRTPEVVDIFLDDNTEEKDKSVKSSSYKVKRGESILYNSFKNWRLLSLLENSVILNRLTKSAITRIIKVQVGDMPKEKVGPHLTGIKQLMEQKTAIDTSKGMSEYTNPGPVENNIYVPVHGDIGAITADTIGGDVNVGELTDLDYFQDKFFGGLRIPKQYFGITKDNAGFSGGESLSIISSRYAKAVKRIQNTIIQMLTDAVNLMLLDKGMESRINQFRLRMQSPTTQEEKDRGEYMQSRIQNIGDIMNQMNDIQDTGARLKILKSMLSGVIKNNDVLQYIQEEIDQLEKGELDEEPPVNDEYEESEIDNIEMPETSTASSDLGARIGLTSEEDEEENNLPTPDSLGQDFSDNETFED